MALQSAGNKSNIAAMTTEAPVKKHLKPRRKPHHPNAVLFTRPMVPEDSDEKVASLLDEMNLDPEVHSRFENMGLHPNLMRGITSYGLENPSYIQQRAIIPAILGRDVIIQAQSGKGKTAALAISVLQRIDLSDPKCQALIIVPTRELAEQVRGVFQDLGKHMGVTTFTCAGGTDIKMCRNKLMKGQQIVVGTTGRLLDMISDENYYSFFDLSSLKTLAIDEADKMMSQKVKIIDEDYEIRPDDKAEKGFFRDLTEIFQEIPVQTQILLISATIFGEGIDQSAKLFMRKPVKILLKREELTLQKIFQYYVIAESKFETFLDIYSELSKAANAKGLIFCNTRSEVKRLSELMTERMKEREEIPYNMLATQGKLPQHERDQILNEFRTGTGCRMVLTTDLLGRGIDVQQVNVVINYDFPDWDVAKQYIHRVGRSARAGRQGIAISLIHDGDLGEISYLEGFYDTKITEMPSIKTVMDLLSEMPSSN